MCVCVLKMVVFIYIHNAYVVYFCNRVEFAVDCQVALLCLLCEVAKERKSSAKKRKRKKKIEKKKAERTADQVDELLFERERKRVQSTCATHVIKKYFSISFLYLFFCFFIGFFFLFLL